MLAAMHDSIPLQKPLWKNNLQAEIIHSRWYRDWHVRWSVVNAAADNNPHDKPMNHVNHETQKTNYDCRIKLCNTHVKYPSFQWQNQMSMRREKTVSHTRQYQGNKYTVRTLWCVRKDKGKERERKERGKGSKYTGIQNDGTKEAV